MRPGRPRGRGGFTLVETAVTITVMGVVAALGYGAFATLIDRRTQIHVAMAETERAAALRAMLEDWFARGSLAIHFDGAASRVGQAEVGGKDKDMLSFVTRAPTASRGWATEMIMFIDDNPATPEHGLTVRYLGHVPNDGVPWIDFSNTQIVQTQDSQLRRVGWMPTARQLDSQIVGLRVEYLDRQTNRWVSARNLNRVGRGLPIAARVTLEGTPSMPLPRLLQLPFLITKQSSWESRQ